MNVLINVVLDKSGSMESTREATISGYNEMLETHKRENPDASFSLALFDSQPATPQFWSPVIDAPAMTGETYQPGGNTALYDAIGQSIRRIERLSEQPERVAFVIVTDGMENNSHEFSLDQVRSLIEWHQNEGKGWDFTFLGANIDSYAVGGSMGVSAFATMDYAATPDSVSAAWGAVATSTSAYASGKATSLGYDSKTKAKVEPTKP